MNKQNYIDYEYQLDVARARIPLTLAQLRDPRYTDNNRNMAGFLERKGKQPEACIIGMSVPGIYGVQLVNGATNFYFEKEYNKSWRIWKMYIESDFPWIEDEGEEV